MMFDGHLPLSVSVNKKSQNLTAQNVHFVMNNVVFLFLWHTVCFYIRLCVDIKLFWYKACTITPSHILNALFLKFLLFCNVLISSNLAPFQRRDVSLDDTRCFRHFGGIKILFMCPWAQNYRLPFPVLCKPFKGSCQCSGIYLFVCMPSTDSKPGHVYNCSCTSLGRESALWKLFWFKRKIRWELYRSHCWRCIWWRCHQSIS